MPRVSASNDEMWTRRFDAFEKWSKGTPVQVLRFALSLIHISEPTRRS